MTTIARQIALLEAQLVGSPGSCELREELIGLYIESGQGDSPRRAKHVLYYVRHYPRRPFARCPLAHLDPTASQRAYEAVERVWQELVAAHPDDPQLLQGLALFVANEDRPRALQLFRAFLQLHPSAYDVWVDLGRAATDPVEGLRAFQQARFSGSEHPNLSVWIARTAVAAGALMTAESAGRELLAYVAHLREKHGERLDWPEQGADLLARAKAATATIAEARTLVADISEAAFRKHWGHTVLGMVSLRHGEISAATAHLHASADVPGDHRLGAYGPSFMLADALCAKEQWEDVAAYLASCTAFWRRERLEELREDVLARRRPEFPAT